MPVAWQNISYPRWTGSVGRPSNWASLNTRIGALLTVGAHVKECGSFLSWCHYNGACISSCERRNRKESPYLAWRCSGHRLWKKRPCLPRPSEEDTSSEESSCSRDQARAATQDRASTTQRRASMARRSLMPDAREEATRIGTTTALPRRLLPNYAKRGCFSMRPSAGRVRGVSHITGQGRYEKRRRLRSRNVREHFPPKAFC